jgi:hypothetical protein
MKTDSPNLVGQALVEPAYVVQPIHFFANSLGVRLAIRRPWPAGPVPTH